MKFVLFVEGNTEHKTLAPFLKRWLDPRLPKPVGIQPVPFQGWADLVKEAPIKADLYLASDDVLSVIALLDLYGPTYPPNKKTADAIELSKNHKRGSIASYRANPKFTDKMTLTRCSHGNMCRESPDSTSAPMPVPKTLAI